MKKCPPLVVSQVSNRGRNFILQVADLMIQRVINGLIILMLNMASSNYTDLLSVKVCTPHPHPRLPIRCCLAGEVGGDEKEVENKTNKKVGREEKDGVREDERLHFPGGGIMFGALIRAGSFSHHFQLLSPPPPSTISNSHSRSY